MALNFDVSDLEKNVIYNALYKHFKGVCGHANRCEQKLPKNNCEKVLCTLFLNNCIE